MNCSETRGGCPPPPPKISSKISGMSQQLWRTARANESAGHLAIAVDPRCAAAFHCLEPGRGRKKVISRGSSYSHASRSKHSLTFIFLKRDPKHFFLMFPVYFFDKCTSNTGLMPDNNTYVLRLY